MNEALLFAYIVAVGFVTAGVLSSFVQLISGQPMRFVVEHRSFAAAVGSVVLRVITGPEILMRNAWRGMIFEKRSQTWFWLAAGIATCWSLLIGCLLIDVILSV
ncbi:MAG: hypothetical protein AAF967_04415 [Pseudomonadota bacterium]